VTHYQKSNALDVVTWVLDNERTVTLPPEAPPAARKELNVSSPYVGEIRMFAGNFAPAGWALCQGQTMAISENDVLFNLIGTTYGGDGQTTFNLPDLQGRVPVHQGTLAGGSSYVIGEKAGEESVTLTVNQIPAHVHPALCNSTSGSSPSPAGGVWAAGSAVAFTPGATADKMNTGVVGAVGGSQPHDNMVPFLAINFIISLFGVFPSQT
jgi:microcystin-dependent protein